MDKEYIEREALKRTLIDKKGFYPAIVKDAIESAPAADVVEVVRCKDCYLRNTEACPFCFWDCGELMGYTEDNDFCSYGKKKDTRKDKDD